MTPNTTARLRAIHKALDQARHDVGRDHPLYAEVVKARDDVGGIILRLEVGVGQP